MEEKKDMLKKEKENVEKKKINIKGKKCEREMGIPNIVQNMHLKKFPTIDHVNMSNSEIRTTLLHLRVSDDHND